MRYYVDTSVLIRFVAPDDPLRSSVTMAVLSLRDEGHELCFAPQCVRDAWSVMTRPKSVNGYGMSNEDAELLLAAVDKALIFLDDGPGIFAKWSELVKGQRVVGKQVHDANHVAAMLVNGISHILTLDDRDFLRYPMITVVHPSDG